MINQDNFIYEKEFKEALEFSRELGLSVENNFIKTEKILDKINKEELMETVRISLGVVSEETFFLQCISINLSIKEILENYLKTPVYYTIGSVYHDEKERFIQTKESLRKMIDNNILENKLNIHVWLTLPSMEILDFTYMTSLGIIQKQQDLIGRVIAKYADEQREVISFHPKVIGEEFVFRAGAAIEINNIYDFFLNTQH